MKVRLHSQVHEWQSRDADRRLRVVRAEWDSRKWTFTETFSDIPDWLPIESPSTEDYEALRDVLWRKYQRKRLPWRFVENVDAILAERRGETPEKD